MPIPSALNPLGYKKQSEPPFLIARWTKRANPASLPASLDYGISYAVFNNVLYMAVAGMQYSPYISVYYLSGSSWVKMAAPPGVKSSYSVKLAVYNGSLYMLCSQISAASEAFLCFIFNGGTWVLQPINIDKGGTSFDVASYVFNDYLYIAATYQTLISTGTSRFDGENSTAISVPSTLGLTNGAAFCQYNGVLYLAVCGIGNQTGRHLDTFYLSGSQWVSMPPPAIPPGGYGTKCSMCVHKGRLYLATATVTAPWMAIYYLDGGEWVKMANPSIIPTTNNMGCALYSFKGYLYLSFAFRATPYVLTYYLNNGAWTKIANPAVLPTGQGEYAVFEKYEDKLQLGIAHGTTPFVTTYYGE